MRPVLFFIIFILISCVGPDSKNKVKGAKNKLAQELDFKDKKKSDNLSQFLRSNTLAYWQWVSQRQINFTQYTQMGLILGDAHVGNMYPTPNFECGSNQQLEWKNIDFDDGGLGPYFFDWVHYLISLKVIDGQLDVERLFESYRNGLQGTDQAPPTSIAQYLSISNGDFESIRKKFVDQRTKKDSFDIGTDDMEVFESGPVDRDQMNSKILKFFNGEARIKDYAQISKKRGGSSDLFRLNILIEVGGKVKIYELKQIADSSLNRVIDQDPPELRYQKLSEYFGYCDKAISIFDFNGTAYLFREKKTALYEVPYQLSGASDQSFFNDLAIWGAYQLGIWHVGRGQSTAKNYLDEINANNKLFLDNSEYFSAQFLDLLQTEYQTRSQN